METARARARSSRAGANDLQRLPGEFLPLLLLLLQRLTPSDDRVVPSLVRRCLQRHREPGVCRLDIREKVSQEVVGNLVLA